VAATLIPFRHGARLASLPLRDLVGAYAGEIGQTQFLPSSYIKYGVDFDGDGRVDLRHSVKRLRGLQADLPATTRKAKIKVESLCAS